MRLRLDKLVLSAGLALAMVATTVPAIAGVTTDTTTTTSATQEFTLNGKSAVSADIAKAVSGEDITEAVATNTAGVKYIQSSSAETTAPTRATITSTTDSALSAYLGDELELVNSVKGGKVVVTETKTYKLSNFTYSETADTLYAQQTAAKTAAENALKAEAGSTSTNISITGGTKDITVASVTGTATYKDKDGDSVAAATEDEPGEAISSIAVNGLSIEVTTKYTYTDLSAINMTYDVVFDDSANHNANIEYSVIKFDGTNGSTVSSFDATEGTAASLTDLSSSNTYYLVKKTISIASELILPAVTNDVYEVFKYEMGIPATAAKTAITTAEEEKGLTHVAYLNIVVRLNGTVVNKTDSAISFKIAPPTDVVSANEGKTITWYVVRNHTYDSNNVTTTVLDTTIDSDGYIVFSSDQFSDFALAYTVAADTTTTEETTDSATDSTTDATTDSTSATTDSTSATTADSSTTSTTASEKTGDNSMMPLFMTTLLLALCAGSLAIYKEKKTN